MKFDFQRYLEAKRSLDDRSLNHHVWEAFTEKLPQSGRLLEVGCGTGVMWQRLLHAGSLPDGLAYHGLDSDPENIAAAAQKVLESDAGSSDIRFFQANLFEYLPEAPYDALIAAAVLDLLDLERALPHLLSFLRPGGLAYFPITFDGLTVFEPALPLDEIILTAYHGTMAEAGGSPATGRLLFSAFRSLPVELLAAGASDWLVYPDREGRYLGDEAYFLAHILHFFETSLSGHPALKRQDLDGWLDARRRQLAGGELTYIAHQFDFLVQKAD